jgi:hypothetical protein
MLNAAQAPDPEPTKPGRPSAASKVGLFIAPLSIIPLLSVAFGSESSITGAGLAVLCAVGGMLATAVCFLVALYREERLAWFVLAAGLAVLLVFAALKN